MLHVHDPRTVQGLSDGLSSYQASQPQTEDAEQFYCKLCDVQCTNADNFENHTAGNKHCKKFLTKQNDLGFEEFEGLYGDVLFSKRCQTHSQPSDKEPYDLHVYRSGLLNKFTCRACGDKTFQMLKWYEHIYSWKHGQKMQHLQKTMTRTLFLNQFGDVPGPNPKLFTDNSGGSNGTQQDCIKQFNELDRMNSEAIPDPLLNWIASLESAVTAVDACATSSSEDLRSQRPTVWKSSASSSSASSREQRSFYDDVREMSRRRAHARTSDVSGRTKADAPSPRKRSSKRPDSHHQQRYDKAPNSESDDDESMGKRRRSEKSSSSHRRREPNGNGKGKEQQEREQMSSILGRPPGTSTVNVQPPPPPDASFVKSTNGASTSSDDVLRRTLYEFVTDVVKRQPEASSSNIVSDEELFNFLPAHIQRHVYNVHVVSKDNSVARCYGAVKFLMALDANLLESVSKFLQEDNRRSGHTAHSSD